jgi:hypothetical protein
MVGLSETGSSSWIIFIALHSSQIIFIRLCCAFYQPHHPVLKCWAKNDMFFLHPFLFCWATYWALLELLLVSALYSSSFSSLAAKLLQRHTFSMDTLM